MFHKALQEILIKDMAMGSIVNLIRKHRTHFHISTKIIGASLILELPMIVVDVSPLGEPVMES